MFIVSSRVCFAQHGGEQKHQFCHSPTFVFSIERLAVDIFGKNRLRLDAHACKTNVGECRFCRRCEEKNCGKSCRTDALLSSATTVKNNSWRNIPYIAHNNTMETIPYVRYKNLDAGIPPVRVLSLRLFSGMERTQDGRRDMGSVGDSL